MGPTGRQHERTTSTRHVDTRPPHPTHWLLTHMNPAPPVRRIVFSYSCFVSSWEAMFSDEQSLSKWNNTDNRVELGCAAPFDTDVVMIGCTRPRNNLAFYRYCRTALHSQKQRDDRLFVAMAGTVVTTNVVARVLGPVDPHMWQFPQVGHHVSPEHSKGEQPASVESAHKAPAPDTCRSVTQHACHMSNVCRNIPAPALLLSAERRSRYSSDRNVLCQYVSRGARSCVSSSCASICVQSDGES